MQNTSWSKASTSTLEGGTRNIAGTDRTLKKGNIKNSKLRTRFSADPVLRRRFGCKRRGTRINTAFRMLVVSFYGTTIYADTTSAHVLSM